MSQTLIDNFWRKPYELSAGITWLVSAVVCFVFGRINDDGFRFFTLLSIPLAIFATVRLTQGISLLNRKARLAVRAECSYTHEDVVAKQAATGDKQVWLGRGFEWGHEHAQQHHDAWLATKFEPQAFRLPAPYLSLRKLLRLPVEPDTAVKVGGGSLVPHGVGVAKEKDLYLPVEWLSYMMWIISTTGGGKTRLLSLLAVQACARGEAVIVFDPKGDADFRDLLYSELVRQGRPGAMHYFSPSRSNISVGINPMTNYQRLTQIASRIVNIMPTGGESESFKSFAWRAINVVLEGLQASGQELTLVNLKRYVEGDISGLMVAVATQFFRSLEHEFPAWELDLLKMTPKVSREQAVLEAKAVGCLTYYQTRVMDKHRNLTIESIASIMKHDRAHYTKLIASLIPILDMLTSGTVGKLLSPQKDRPEYANLVVDFEGIVRRREVAYITTESLADGVVSSAILSLMIADLTSVAFESYLQSDTRAPDPVSVFVDEAGEAINNPLIQQLNKGRGARFRVAICSQVVSDITVRMGSEDATMQAVGNTNITMALRVKDPKTKELVSEMSGQTTLRVAELSTSTTGYSPAENVDFVGSYGTSFSSTEGTLIPEAALPELPPLDYFALLPGNKCVKGRVPFVKPSHTFPATRRDYLALDSTVFDAYPCDDPSTHPAFADIV